LAAPHLLKPRQWRRASKLTIRLLFNMGITSEEKWDQWLKRETENREYNQFVEQHNAAALQTALAQVEAEQGGLNMAENAVE